MSSRKRKSKIAGFFNNASVAAIVAIIGSAAFAALGGGIYLGHAALPIVNTTTQYSTITYSSVVTLGTTQTTTLVSTYSTVSIATSTVKQVTTFTLTTYPAGKTLILSAANYTETNVGGLLVGKVSSTYAKLYIGLPNPGNYDGSTIFFSSGKNDSFSLGVSCQGESGPGNCHGNPASTITMPVEGIYVGVSGVPNGANVSIYESPY